MSRNEFQNLIKRRREINALEYLHNKRGSKGNEIEFTSLQMSEYLLPYNSMMNIEEKRELFALRNRMTDIPNHFGKKRRKMCVWDIGDNVSYLFM